MFVPRKTSQPSLMSAQVGSLPYPRTSDEAKKTYHDKQSRLFVRDEDKSLVMSLTHWNYKLDGLSLQRFFRLV